MKYKQESGQGNHVKDVRGISITALALWHGWMIVQSEQRRDRSNDNVLSAKAGFGKINTDDSSQLTNLAG